MRRKYIVHELDAFGQVRHNNMAPTATPHATTRGWNVTLDDQSASLVVLPDVAVTLVATEPIVAVGGGAFTPFIANAVPESDAKPTEAGLYLNTEYTFFCAHSPASVKKGTKFKRKVAYEERITDDPIRSIAIGVDLKERADALVGTDLGELEISWAYGPARSAE